ncbi:MAG: UPF0164 family protein [Bacteroidales bacterium]|jgi:hypothetical protein|nr:UPF0164 family protein [Bacteroidales bacterium]
MKKITLIIASALTLLPLMVSGQNMDDVLRYSRLFYQGSARFNAMGGAFTALGGDISSIAINPAAAAVFRSTEFAVTTNMLFRNTETNYNGYNSIYDINEFNLGSAGLVAAGTMGSGSGLVGLSFAYTYNQTNDFREYTVIDGVSEASSMADYWAAGAYGYNTWELIDYTSAPYMAYEAWLIDTLSGSFTEYASIFSYYGEMDPAYGQRTRRTIDNGGYTGDHTIAFGANISDILYIGAGFGIQALQYTGHYLHSEEDTENNVPDLVNFNYTDHFNASGTGWNFKGGIILRPLESLRLGFSFASPTVYKIDEVFYSNLSAFLDNDTPGDSSDDADPLVEQTPQNYAYRITTPWRFNTGLALQLGMFALVSADFEYVDYSKAYLSYGLDGYNFISENDELRTELKGAATLRLGAEIRLGSLYLRGGAGYTQSAFKEGSLNESSDFINLSGGIGYRQKNFYVDLSVAGQLNSEVYMMYPDGWLEPTNIDNRDINGALTVGIKF